MQQTEKSKPQKYTNGPSPSWSGKYQTNVRDTSNANWKYVNKHNSSVPLNKGNRKQFNATVEPITSYYSSMNSYKQNKHHNYESPTHTKYTTSQNLEPHRWISHNHTRTPRNKLYTANNNVAIVRKPNYNKNELEDDENVRYADEELGNFTEDNFEEDAIDEEVEEDQDETAESVDKDYEEHEADDEIDEESDSTVLRSQKLQMRSKKNGISQEQQRSRIIKQQQQQQQQQQDPRKLHYQQYMQNSYESHPSRIRYYHDQDDRDPTELYTNNEEPIRPPTPPKSSVRRSGTNHHQHWTPSRNSSDRYDNIIPSLNQSIRRSQPRKDVEDLLHSENKNTKKCIRCGAPPGNRFSTKNKKNICRFQEYPDFVVKESFGNDMDAVEKILCGRCNVKHNYEDIEGSSYRSTGSNLQTLKPRRSKGTKGISEVTEDFPKNEEIQNDYMTNRYSRDPSANTVHERTRHSAQTTRGPIKSFSRYGV
ncbi:hypothetical protein M0802_008797 [Mischocyttarus mexicanus]|nr:hypothetical protein M0802_008797 [Mischocyttarus mexicanus]